MVRKAYSPNTHDYKNTKMTEILTMTLTPQLRKKAIKKRASHPSSIREPNINFRKLVDKIEQAEISMKLEETENLKLQYVNSIHTTISQINKVHDSDTELAEKITQNLNIYEKNPNFKGKQSFKKWCNCCRRYGKRIAECRQKQQDNQNKPQKRREPIKSFYQYMKIYQIKKTFTVTKFQENRSLITIIPLDNHHFNEITIAEDLQKKIHEISHKIDLVDQTVKTINIEITIQDQTQTEVITQITKESFLLQLPKQIVFKKLF